MYQDRSQSHHESGNLGTYLDQIGKTDVLSAEVEVELAKRIEAGLYADYKLTTENETLNKQEQAELAWLADDGRQAKVCFINANLRLVVKIAKTYGGSTLEDRIQEGNTGVIRAVEKFDFTKGYKFSTYASWWIKKAIKQTVRERDRLIPLSRGAADAIDEVYRAEKALINEGVNTPVATQIAEYTGNSLSRVREILRWRKAPISLETPITSDPSNLFLLKDTLPGDDSLGSGDTETVSELLDSLDPRTADIIRCRYGIGVARPMTYEAIGPRHNVSNSRARQIAKVGIENLQAEVLRVD